MRIEQQSMTNALNGVGGESAPAAAASRPATETPTVMPEIQQLVCSGDPGAILAALTMQTAKNERDVSRKQRDAAMAAQEKADAGAVQDMHDKANLQRAQGIFDGAMQIGQGVCDLGAGMNECASADAKNDAANEKDMMANGYAQNDDQRAAMQGYAESRSADAVDDGRSAAWDKFGSSAFSAGKSIGDGFFSGAITDKDADEKMHEASASTFKQIADDAHDAENDAKALLNKALDFYKEYVDTKNQTAMAAIHRA
jgi:hypothetical protein